jgi:hypothetical protein
VIRPEDPLSDEGVFEARKQKGRNEEIIDAPTDVAFAGTGEVRPPRVLFGRIGVKMAEGVDESAVDEFLKTRTLFVGKPGISTITPGIGKVDFLVRHVQIAANDDRLGFFERFQMVEKKRIPELAVFEALEFAFGIRSIDRYEEEIVEFEGSNAPFVVIVNDSAHAVSHGKGLLSRKNRRSRIPGTFGRVPKGSVSHRGKFEGNGVLIFFRFHLLQSHDIGIFYGEIVEKPFRDAGADSVHVPGDEFHADAAEKIRGEITPSRKKGKCLGGMDGEKPLNALKISIFHEKLISCPKPSK